MNLAEVIISVTGSLFVLLIGGFCTVLWSNFQRCIDRADRVEEKLLNKIDAIERQQAAFETHVATDYVSKEMADKIFDELRRISETINEMGKSLHVLLSDREDRRKQRDNKV